MVFRSVVLPLPCNVVSESAQGKVKEMLTRKPDSNVIGNVRNVVSCFAIVIIFSVAARFLESSSAAALLRFFAMKKSSTPRSESRASDKT